MWSIRSGRWVLHADEKAPIFTGDMNALTRLIVVIYGLGAALAAISPLVSIEEAMIGASCVAAPILLIAWIFAGFRRAY